MCPDPDPSARHRIDSFALVSYIPEPLAGFLNRLRQELVPNCFLRAHVTILPPRPCSTSAQAATEEVCSAVRAFHPFDVTLHAVEVFSVSDVIFISIAGGDRQLRDMHETLNYGGLEVREAFPFHPHITLAQNLRPDEVDELTRVARTRWAAFPHSRSFRVEALTFVQATRYKTWIDLAECKLSEENIPTPSARR